jgi:MOSC domain-containing protein YiiM
MPGKVLAVCISIKKGTVKDQVDEIRLVPDHGVLGDAHAGPGDRQVSLLAEEKIEIMRQKGLDLAPGAFGENIVVSGIDLENVRPGAFLRIGPEVNLEITRIGKECHTRCAIYYKTGDCIMPTYGIFMKVIFGGTVRKDDIVTLVER